MRGWLQGPAAEPPTATPSVTASRRLQIAPAEGSLVAATRRAAQPRRT